MLKTVVFDFGGVLAEEGFREGLKEIARKNRLSPEVFFSTAESIIYETGYLTGNAPEQVYWNTVRERTGITASDRDLRGEILNRFMLRQKMIEFVDVMRFKRFKTAILSDQTNWLDEINEKTLLFSHFDHIFNSFHLHKSKRDEAVFGEVCKKMNVNPAETVFIDDNENHIRRAHQAGLLTIHFTTVDDFIEKMRVLEGIGKEKHRF